MKLNETIVRTLTPAEGHKLTQSADVAPTERIIATNVRLAAGASPDDWREITADQANAYLKAAAEARAEQKREQRRAELRRQLSALE